MRDKHTGPGRCDWGITPGLWEDTWRQDERVGMCHRHLSHSLHSDPLISGDHESLPVSGSLGLSSSRRLVKVRWCWCDDKLKCGQDSDSDNWNAIFVRGSGDEWIYNCQVNCDDDQDKSGGSCDHLFLSNYDAHSSLAGTVAIWADRTG